MGSVQGPSRLYAALAVKSFQGSGSIQVLRSKPWPIFHAWGQARISCSNPLGPGLFAFRLRGYSSKSFAGLGLGESLNPERNEQLRKQHENMKKSSEQLQALEESSGKENEPEKFPEQHNDLDKNLIEIEECAEQHYDQGEQQNHRENCSEQQNQWEDCSEQQNQWEDCSEQQNQWEDCCKQKEEMERNPLGVDNYYEQPYAEQLSQNIVKDSEEYWKMVGRTDN
jgi:hypothetical protein